MQKVIKLENKFNIFLHNLFLVILGDFIWANLMKYFLFVLNIAIFYAHSMYEYCGGLHRMRFAHSSSRARVRIEAQFDYRTWMRAIQEQ